MRQQIIRVYCDRCAAEIDESKNNIDAFGYSLDLCPKCENIFDAKLGDLVREFQIKSLEDVK